MFHSFAPTGDPMLIDPLDPVPSKYEYELAGLEVHFQAAVQKGAADLAAQTARNSEFGMGIAQSTLDFLHREWDAVKDLRVQGADMVTTEFRITGLPGYRLADQVAAGRAEPVYVMDEAIPR